MIAGERQRSALWLSVAALVVNLGLNIALVPSHGVTAAAAVALGTEALLLAGGWLLVRRGLDVRPAIAGLWRILLAATVMAAAIWPLRERTPALTVPLGAAVYGLVLAALGGIDRRALEELRG